MKWVYLAGLVDGDGSIFISKRNSHAGKKHGTYRLILSVSNCNQDLLNTLEDTYDRDRVAFKSKNYEAARISWEGPKAKAIIKKIIAHLLGKKEQAKLALTFPCVGQGGLQGASNKEKSAIRNHKFDMYKAMKKLNKKWSKGKAWRD